VKAIAVRVHENLPVHVDLDDLVHAGILGLFDAASKFNPDKQVVFSSYAKHRIKGAILDSLRQLDWASRDLRRRHKQVEAATHDLAATLQRTPTEDEIAAKLGINVDRWRQMMIDLRNAGLVSASARPTEHEDLPAPDFPSKPETQPARQVQFGLKLLFRYGATYLQNTSTVAERLSPVSKSFTCTVQFPTGSFSARGNRHIA